MEEVHGTTNAPSLDARFYERGRAKPLSPLACVKEEENKSEYHKLDDVGGGKDDGLAQRRWRDIKGICS